MSLVASRQSPMRRTRSEGSDGQSAAMINQSIAVAEIVTRVCDSPDVELWTHGGEDGDIYGLRRPCARACPSLRSTAVAIPTRGYRRDSKVMAPPLDALPSRLALAVVVIIAAKSMGRYTFSSCETSHGARKTQSSIHRHPPVAIPDAWLGEAYTWGSSCSVLQLIPQRQSMR